MNERQEQAVRYYIGDVSGDDPFWGCGKAYIVLNSLFFDGISTELARAAEGKRLEPAIIADTDRLLSLYDDLFSAFSSAQSEKTAFRVERMADFEEIRRRGMTVSFTSTSTAGFLREYRDRKGIALIKFTIPSGCPCICMEEALNDYAKADEHEILLPPFLSLRIKELPISAEYMDITDSAGESPLLYCEAEPYSYDIAGGKAVSLPEGGAEAGMRFYEALNSGKGYSQEDTEKYICWKKAICQRLRGINMHAGI